MTDTTDNNLLTLTTEIVSAHVSHNSVAVADLPGLIKSVFGALQGMDKPVEVAPAKQEPAVSIRSSIKPDYLVCLEDGKKLTMLKRYLQTNFQMTPQQYRAKWNLPSDYPMVAPSYAERRRDLAHKIGLGRGGRNAKAVSAPEPAPAPKAARKPRGIAAAKAAAQAHLGTTDTPPTE